MRTFNTSLISKGIETGDFELHSGSRSSWRWNLDSCDWQKELPYWIDTLVEDNSINRAGIETGGQLLAWMSPSFTGMLRITKEGIVYIRRPLRSWQVILIDDVVTTGQSMEDAEIALDKHGIEVVQRICVLDRREEESCRIVNQHRQHNKSYERGVLCDNGGFWCNNWDMKVSSLFKTSDLVAAGLVPERTL